MFPSHAQGCYMRDDVLAAFEWRDVLGNHGLYRDGGLIDVKEALFFEPGEPDARPFAWVRELFDYRAALVKIDANDVRAIVIKLMLNSIYGKFAQGVGNPGSPPRFASPWMAAAITAGTRRKVLKAALTAPKAVVSFMTDGIVAEKILPIATSAPGVKELGEWEAAKVHESGGVFVQSGFYYLTEPKTRGFKAAKAGDPAVPRDERVRKIMLEDIPACWKDGKSSYEFDYSQYLGLGSAVQSVDATAGIGCWKTSRRSQQLDTMSRKRVVPASPKLRRSRAERLIALGVSDGSDDLVDGKWSAPHKPDWLNKDAENEFDREEETKNAMAGRT
jgi:hypothetical protein